MLKINSEVWEFLGIFSTILFIMGLVSGQLNKTCNPESIGGMIALPYRVGCELTVPRFKK